jgi:hypothetical protein
MILQVSVRLNRESVQCYAPPVRSQGRISRMDGRMLLKINGEPLCHLTDNSKPNASCSWLYTLFLGIDANFRLKRKKVSNDAADPDLNHGCAYFVEEREYKEYLKKFVKETEPVSHIHICRFL